MNKLVFGFLSVFVVFFGPSAFAFSSAPVSVDRIVSVYDGDTFRITIDSWPEIIGQDIGVRLKGVDTPEIRGKCDYEKQRAIEAREFVRDKLVSAKKVVLVDVDRGKYFRIVSFVRVDGEDLSEMVISEGLGRPYDGGSRLGWCDSVESVSL